MADEMSYRVSEKEYEAMAVLRDVIILVADEVESNLGYNSPGLDSIRDCANQEVRKAEIELFN